MANIIIQKHSVAAGAEPTTAQIVVGELAINAADGNVFIRTATDDIVNLLDYAVADGGEITS